jgi:hypothetical protein
MYGYSGLEPCTTHLDADTLPLDPIESETCGRMGFPQNKVEYITFVVRAILLVSQYSTFLSEVCPQGQASVFPSQKCQVGLPSGDADMLRNPRGGGKVPSEGNSALLWHSQECFERQIDFQWARSQREERRSSTLRPSRYPSATLRTRCLFVVNTTCAYRGLKVTSDTTTTSIRYRWSVRYQTILYTDQRYRHSASTVVGVSRPKPITTTIDVEWGTF